MKKWFYITKMLSSICLCREESSLVDQFVFEVLVIFVESLGLAHSDEPSMGNCFPTSALLSGYSDFHITISLFLS